jgi:phosphoglycolate phosphatase-like HAD superfamily hydrolase
LSLRIAFDLDGVLADMDSAIASEAAVSFGGKRLSGRQLPTDVEARTSPTDQSRPTPPGRKLSARQQRRAWRRIAAIEDFWQTLREVEPGIVKRLATIAVARRWEVIFLTKRPATAGLTAQAQSQRWLAAHGFERPSVYVVQGSRGLIAAALELDVVVDDRVENCYDVIADSRAKALLVSGDGQLSAAAQRAGVRVFATLTECLDMLADLDLDAPDRSQAPT